MGVDKVSPVGAGSVSACRQGALVAGWATPLPSPPPPPSSTPTSWSHWPSRPRRNPLRNSVSSNDTVCRTELCEEATKTREWRRIQRSLHCRQTWRTRRISSSRPGSCLEPTSGTGRRSSATSWGWHWTSDTLSVQLEALLSRARGPEEVR